MAGNSNDGTGETAMKSRSFRDVLTQLLPTLCCGFGFWAGGIIGVRFGLQAGFETAAVAGYAIGVISGAVIGSSVGLLWQRWLRAR